jgi:hypothetical protein
LPLPPPPVGRPPGHFGAAHGARGEDRRGPIASHAQSTDDKVQLYATTAEPKTSIILAVRSILGTMSAVRRCNCTLFRNCLAFWVARGNRIPRRMMR